MTKCPSIEDLVKKMTYIYRMEYYSLIEKYEIVLCVATWLDIQGIVLNEISEI